MVMKKYKILLGTALSTIMFSGAVFAHGVSNDQSGDILTGHSSDHKDPALMNSTNAQVPDIGHTNEQDGEDILHQLSEHKAVLSASPGSPPDQHYANQDDTPSFFRIGEH